MIKIDSITLGFALYIACEYSSNLEHRKENDGDVEDLKSKSTRDLIAWLTPQGVIEEMQEQTDPLMMDIIDFYMDPLADFDFDQDTWAYINEVENNVERFVNLVDEGKLWGLVATNMAVWSERNVGEDDPGVLVDQSFFVTLVERVQNTKHTLLWEHGPFQAIAGCSEMDWWTA